MNISNDKGIVATVAFVDESHPSKEIVMSWVSPNVELVNINDSTMELTVIDKEGYSLKVTFSKPN